LKNILIGLFCFLNLFVTAQVKTLIPAEEEVNLPLDSAKKISMSVSFDETMIKHDKLVPLFLAQIQKTLNGKQYFILDKGSNFIEIFVVYPCRGFNLANIQTHEILNEGIVTSTLFIQFNKEEYDISLTDFEWVDRKKTKHNLDLMYQSYLSNLDLKEKVKHYGILKSGELSIAETFSNLTVIIEEIIRQKDKK
jgi:hypothetical protein